MLRSLEVITSMHCTVFVLPRLLICLTKHALGLALSLPDCGSQPDVHGVSHDENTVVSDLVPLLVKLGYTQKLV